MLDLSLTKSHAVVGATEPHPKGIRSLSSMQHPSQYSRVKSQKIVPPKERTVWQRAIPSAPEGHSVPFVGFSIPILLRESLSNIYIDSVKREGFGLYYKSERGHPDVGLVSLSILLRGSLSNIYILLRGLLDISLSTLLFKYLNCIAHWKEDIRQRHIFGGH